MSKAYFFYNSPINIEFNETEIENLTEKDFEEFVNKNNSILKEIANELSCKKDKNTNIQKCYYGYCLK